MAGLALGTVCPTLAQQGQSAPSLTYQAAFSPFYEGDYLEALRIFQSECRGSIKSAQSRWIDSICYETMCGECYFQMGYFDKALEHYTAAVQLAARFSTWMTKVQFRPIGAAAPSARKMVPWGATSRQTRMGQFPSSVPILQGQTAMNDVVQRGGVVQQANLYPIIPQEIIRTTALAIRRRAAILGPASKYDPLTNETIVALSRQLTQPNHWAECWANVERGFAAAAGGKDATAAELLKKSITAAGEFDHPLTPMVLLELGRMMLARAEYAAAAKLFEEATYAAVNYQDYGVLEEAFRYGAFAHLAANGKGIYPPLEPAIQWTKTNRLRQLRASLLLCVAENYAVLGQTPQAAAMLDEARATIGRRKMGEGAIGARLNYLSALVAYQQRRTSDGNAMLTAAMEYMRHGSLWLFHIRSADALYQSGNATARVASDLFTEVLRDPQPADWICEPMESLAVLATPHPAALEHWFESTLERKETATAVEIAERIRRHRFFTSLEFGGRIETLRWVLESPAENLPQPAKLQRQDLLARFPAYSQLSQQARKIRDSLAKKSMVADDAAALKEQMREFEELASVSAKQEAVLREIALRREPAEMVFPPLKPLANVQKNIPDKQAVLGFLATSKQLHGFLLNNEQVGVWTVKSPAEAMKKVQLMLREMGNYQQNHELTLKDVADAKWKQSGKMLLDMLLKNSPADFTQSFDELTIVPDGFLWYVPFDALQVNADGRSVPLISRFKIRYAPTVSLTFSKGPGRNTLENTAVLLGKLYPRDDDAVARSAFEQFSTAVPGAVALKSPSPAAPHIYGTIFRQLVVFNDLASSEKEKDPYNFVPAPFDRVKGGTLGDWLALPWGAPDVIVLPGFHTAAEDSLKRVDRVMPGNEVFLTVCALMANGSRTVLLSRWRSGGQTSFDLIREFVQELPRTSPADAWQRAVLLTAGSRLNLEAEPRVKHAKDDDAPKANHPFFWAGYLLVDCGTSAEATREEPAQKPIPSFKPPTDPKEPPAKQEKEPGADSKDEKPAEKNATDVPEHNPIPEGKKSDSGN